MDTKTLEQLPEELGKIAKRFLKLYISIKPFNFSQGGSLGLVPDSKAITVGLEGNNAMLLVEFLNRKTNKGNSTGRWWASDEKHIPTLYSTRQKVPVDSKKLRYAFSGFYAMVELLRKLPEFLVIISNYVEQGESPGDIHDYAVMAKVYYYGELILVFGEAPDLKFKPEITTEWQRQ